MPLNNIVQIRINHYKKIWSIAWPAILANTSLPLTGLVDTWAISHMHDTNHLAAIGMSVLIFNYLFWAFGFLRMGTTGVIAQASGRNNQTALIHMLLRSVLIALTIGFFLFMLQALIWKTASHVIAAPENVTSLAYQYFEIMVWAFPAVLFTLVISGVFIGLGQTKSLLYLQFFLNIANTILNVILVVKMGYGVAGVALGTVVANYLTVVFGLFLLFKTFDIKDVMNEILDRALWQFKDFQSLFTINGFLFLRTLLLITAIASTITISADMGAVHMASSHIMLQFILLLSLGLDGFAYASESLVGKAYGAGHKKELREWIYDTNMMAFAASLIYALFFGLFGHMFVEILTDDKAVQGIMRMIMPLLIMMPVVAVWSYQYDGIYIGITASRAMFLTMCIASFVYFVLVGTAAEKYGFQGLWVCYLLFLGLRGLSQEIYLRCYMRAGMAMPIKSSISDN